MTNHKIRNIIWPQKWPDPPVFMSFSTLRNIEACPLRWALTHACYEDLWSGEGYPSKPSVAAITGLVIHGAIETVIREANTLLDGSLRARMLETMRSLGGLTALIEQILGQVLNGYLGNPRAAPLVDKYRSGQYVLSQKVRTDIQSLLQKIAQKSINTAIYREKLSTTNEEPKKALPYGLYTEIVLHAANVRWLGKIDLLNLTPDNITIEDIKTGQAKDADLEQLLTYAWLWLRDESRNPQKRIPTQLRIRYLDSIQNVSVPDEPELLRFEQLLLSRTSQVLSDIDSDPPEARPNPANCRYCGVRQLCDSYWQNILNTEQGDGSRYGDVEAVLVGALSPKTWEIELTAGSNFVTGSKAIVRGSLPTQPFSIGCTVRILDAAFQAPENDYNSIDLPIIQLLKHSEIFVLQDINAQA